MVRDVSKRSTNTGLFADKRLFAPMQHDFHDSDNEIRDGAKAHSGSRGSDKLVRDVSNTGLFAPSQVPSAPEQHDDASRAANQDALQLGDVVDGKFVQHGSQGSI